MEREKRNDKHSIKSASSLKNHIGQNIKNVFKTALKCIEMRFGDDFEGYHQIRAEILRSGNDSIRQTEEMIDNWYNVEELPQNTKIVFKRRES